MRTKLLMQENLPKLNALRNICVALAKFYHSSVPYAEVDNLFEQFEVLRTAIDKERPDLFNGFKLQGYKRFDSGNGSYWKNSLYALRDDITYYIDILAALEDLSVPNLKFTNEGIFFAGQQFDALLKLVDIIKTSRKSLILLDGYISEKILGLFASLEGTVQIKVLTKAKSLNATLNILINEFNKQYNDSLSIKASEEFHDRFLIIDEKEFYHIGASVKDAGVRGFMFSKIEEPIIQKALISEFNRIWL